MRVDYAYELKRQHYCMLTLLQQLYEKIRDNTFCNHVLFQPPIFVFAIASKLL